MQPTFVSSTFGNKQYFPARTADTSTAIGNADDLLGSIASGINMFFKYESDPILARITTNKRFGIDSSDFSTAADRFQLAVYETEPVISNLDIYWETSHTGLISDLNAEALTGFDGPVGLDGWNDILNENLAVNSSVSQGFVPVNSDNVEITGYNINLDSVVNTNNDDVSNNFSLQYDSGNNEYYIQLDQELVFVQQSPTRDIFTFTFTITDTNPSSEWGSVQLSETLELSNTAPTFDVQPAQTYYYFFEDSTTSFQIRNFLTQNTARNGSAGSGINQNGLVWSISGANANLFSINSTTGVLSPSIAGVAAGFNTYEVDVTLKDASGIAAGGSVTQTYYIIKGFTPTNVSIGSKIPSFLDGAYGDNFPTMPQPNTREYIFYVAANSLTESQLPGDPNITATFLHRFGTQALTQGAMQFGIENIHTTGNSVQNPYGYELEITPYYRAGSSGTWINTTSSSVPPKDLNNRLFVNQFGGGTTTTIRNNSSIAPTYRSNIFYAQNTPGEYAWVVTITRAQISGVNSYGIANFYGVLRDLHYTGSFNSGDQEIYKYRIYDNNGAGWPSVPTSWQNIGTGTIVYSDQPLAEYNTKFWTNNNLSTVYTPPVANKYYLIELNEPSPLVDDKKYFTEQNVGNEIWGAAILSSTGEIQRTSTGPHVTTLTVISNGTLSVVNPFPRRTSNTIQYYN